MFYFDNLYNLLHTKKLLFRGFSRDSTLAKSPTNERKVVSLFNIKLSNFFRNFKTHPKNLNHTTYSVVRYSRGNIQVASWSPGPWYTRVTTVTSKNYNYPVPKFRDPVYSRFTPVFVYSADEWLKKETSHVGRIVRKFYIFESNRLPVLVSSTKFKTESLPNETL